VCRRRLYEQWKEDVMGYFYMLSRTRRDNAVRKPHVCDRCRMIQDTKFVSHALAEGYECDFSIS